MHSEFCQAFRCFFNDCDYWSFAGCLGTRVRVAQCPRLSWGPAGDGGFVKSFWWSRNSQRSKHFSFRHSIPAVIQKKAYYRAYHTCLLDILQIFLPNKSAAILWLCWWYVRLSLCKQPQTGASGCHSVSSYAVGLLHRKEHICVLPSQEQCQEGHQSSISAKGQRRRNQWDYRERNISTHEQIRET